MARQFAVLVPLMAAAACGCVNLPWQTRPDSIAALKQTVKKSNGRSPEALGPLVDGLYLKILSRPANAAERTGWVTMLRSGASVEQVVITLVASPEYTRSAGDDAAFLQSLYRRLLGRDAFAFETAALLPAVRAEGRARVGEVIVKSAEFRSDVIRQLYGVANPSPVAAAFPALAAGTAPPSAEAVSAWAAADTDLLGLEAIIAANPAPEPAKTGPTSPSPVR
jgi:hypothetical protein